MNALLIINEADYKLQHDQITIVEYEDIVNQLVDVEPIKHGRWLSSQSYAEDGECYCSVCKTVYYADDLYQVGETDENGMGQALMPNYCPHCGAKMNEATE